MHPIMVEAVAGLEISEKEYDEFLQKVYDCSEKGAYTVDNFLLRVNALEERIAARQLKVAYAKAVTKKRPVFIPKPIKKSSNYCPKPWSSLAF